MVPVTTGQKEKDTINRLERKGRGEGLSVRSGGTLRKLEPQCLRMDSLYRLTLCMASSQSQQSVLLVVARRVFNSARVLLRVLVVIVVVKPLNYKDLPELPTSLREIRVDK